MGFCSNVSGDTRRYQSVVSYLAGFLGASCSLGPTFLPLRSTAVARFFPLLSSLAGTGGGLPGRPFFFSIFSDFLPVFLVIVEIVQITIILLT